MPTASTRSNRGSYGILGVVDADRNRVYRDVVKRHAGTTEFDVSAIEDLPRVDVVMTYQGATGDIIKAIVDQGAMGDRHRRGRCGSDERNAGRRHPLRAGQGVLWSSRPGPEAVAGLCCAAPAPRGFRRG